MRNADSNRQRQLYEFGKGLEGHPASVGTAMVQAGQQLVLEGLRAPVSAADFEAIKRSYPPATLDVATEHRLTPVGIQTLLALSCISTRKYLDHQPECDSAADRAKDEAAEASLGELSDVLHGSFQRCLDGGASLFGTFVTVVLNATMEAKTRGMPIAKLANVLVEAIQIAMDEDPAPRLSEKELEERAVKALAQQMGISERTARKYAREARRSLQAQGLMP